MYRQWQSLGLDAWTLGLEASSVIALRTAKVLSGGDANGDEARLMVSEKLAVALEVQSAMLSGALGGSPSAATKKVIGTYTRKVRANRKRLE